MMQKTPFASKFLIVLGMFVTASPLAYASVPSAPALGFTHTEVSNPERNHDVAGRLAELVRDYYHDEAMGRRLHELLIRNIKAGRYANASSGGLSTLLTEDLRSISKDLHFSVRLDPSAPTIASPPPPMPVPVSKPGPVPSERDKMYEMSAAQIAAARIGNYGIARAQILPGNVGLVEIDIFAFFTKEVPARYAAVFTLLQDTDALIIDISETGGGHGATAAYVASYLFDREPFLMNRIHRRGRSTVENWTFDRLEGPVYGEKRPVFLLTSRATASASEAFAYDLKNLKRAILVGEKTAGAANPGRTFHIGHGYSAFISQGYAESPITKSNWEGLGVLPDVEVSASAALDRARLEASKLLMQGASSDQKRVHVWQVQALEAKLNSPPLTAASTSGLAGKYAGGRQILERAGNLIYRRADGVERELVPLGADLFAIGEHTSSTRLRFNRTNGSVTGAAFVTATGPDEVVAREGN